MESQFLDEVREDVELLEGMRLSPGIGEEDKFRDNHGASQNRPQTTLALKIALSCCIAAILAIVGFFIYTWSTSNPSLPSPPRNPPKQTDVVVNGPSRAGSTFYFGHTTSILPASFRFELAQPKPTIPTQPATREYIFNISRGVGDPDGVRKLMILVNGQSPGPVIEANIGDKIRVIVHNSMLYDETTIHWHGIDQRNSVWMDGVHTVTQCGIPPGKSFTYEFDVPDQRGSFWYHAHVSVQYTDGLYGPLVILLYNHQIHLFSI